MNRSRVSMLTMAALAMQSAIGHGAVIRHVDSPRDPEPPAPPQPRNPDAPPEGGWSEGARAPHEAAGEEGEAVIADARRAELGSLGYYVEDMGKVYGERFGGQYRWMLERDETLVDFQDHDTSDSEDRAWRNADEHQRRAK